MESQVFSLLKLRKVVQPTDFSYFVTNPLDRKAFFRFLTWSHLFGKVFMDNNLLYFVPKYKAPKKEPNPNDDSRTTPTSEPTNSTNSAHLAVTPPCKLALLLTPQLLPTPLPQVTLTLATPLQNKIPPRYTIALPL